MYKVTHVDGKGCGAFASKELEPGILILRENPAIFINLRILDEKTDGIVKMILVPSESVEYEGLINSVLTIEDHEDSLESIARGDGRVKNLKNIV